MNIRQRLHGASAAIGLAAVLFSATGLAPEPDPIPRRWQLAIEPGSLRVASMEIAGQGTQAYYYLTYKVTNTSSEDLLFAPSFELTTDEGDSSRSGRDVPPEATKEILNRLDNPLIQDQIAIVGTLLQGEANAKEGVVIWPVRNLHVHEIDVYAAGFSGETRPYEVKAADGKTERKLLRKTLMLRFDPPGELRNQGSAPIDLTEKRWIMR